MNGSWCGGWLAGQLN